MNKNLINPRRLAFLALIMVAVTVFYVTVLYKLQIIDGNAYYEQSQNNIVSTETIPASRGNILDRYGRLLVSNRSCSNIIINTDELFAQDNPNAVILKLVNAVTSCGDTYIDELPITADAPFEYVENMSAIQRTRLEAYIENIRANYDEDFPEDPTAVELMAFFRSRYDIDDNYDARQMRIIAGIRYELNVRYVVKTSDYVFAEDVSTKTITTLLEMGLPGFTLETSYIREYNTTYACHILGRVGLIGPEDVEKYSALGYPLNAIVGKEGVELAFEEYLHGVDGEAQVTSTASGTVINTFYTTEPQPGGNVYLTLDIELQGVAETALESFITKLNSDREVTNAQAEASGYMDAMVDMATGGGMVVIDIKTGEPLASASYPTFDLSTYLEDYNDLLADENAPLYNRATQGLYAPGSTFKLCTAIASLEEGVITTGTTIYDETEFTKYADAGYAPRCWIYGKGSHGTINVTQALTVSCNHFFYTVGDLLGIDKMAEYANKLGLGASTGIEIYEETGHMSTRKYKEELTGVSWYNGDTLQAAIGQSYSQFTPLQLAIYTATIANNGTRYSASMLKSVRSFDYTENLYEREPEILDTVVSNQANYDAIHQGMWGVANSTSGTAYSVFWNYPQTVAAKTGTAQLGETVTNNAVFICYAPYEDPQIAIAVVIEHGGGGSAISSVVLPVLDYYFSFQNASVKPESEETLLK